MEEYRFKHYWNNGNVTFDTITANKSFAFATAREMVKNFMIKKVDVYQGTKLIATFYK